jgi:exosortase/archaeosortase family protein
MNKNFLTKYNLNTKKIVIIAIIVLLFLLAIFARKNPEIGIYRFFTNIYSGILMAISQIILKLSKADIVFYYTKNLIVSEGKNINVNAFFYSLNQLAILFVTVLITKSNYKDKFLFFLSGLFIYLIYNALRISFHVIYPDTLYVKNEWFNLLLIPQWLILIWIIYFFWQKNPEIKNLIFNKYKIQDKSYKSFIIKLSVITVIYYLTIIVFYSQSFIISGRLLVDTLLNTSRYFINLLGYDAVLMGRTLRSQQAALYMDDSCVGINLMFLFAAFIVLMPGKLSNKLWYIPLGIILILIYNISRIVLIFLSIANNEGHYVLPIDVHDVYTYPVLIFTFYMWMIWINKFSKAAK